VLGKIPGDARHFCRTSHKYALIAPEEIDELAFLFGVQASPDLDGLGEVFDVDLHGLSILNRFENTG
jgi:hypothetical protein